MPSTLLGFFSGGQSLVSGNPWSGRVPQPTGLRLTNWATSSGTVFIATSGGVTITSGGALSSGGLRDGMPIAPGANHEIRLPATGPAGVYVAVLPAASGFVRLFWEPTN